MDIAKGIGILLVVLGHTEIPKGLWNFIYTFHMPLFFIISGYLFNFEKWKSQGMRFLKSRAKRLLFPYFTLSLLVFYPLYCIRTHFSDYLRQFIGIFYGNSVNHFMDFNLPEWFLPCLFVSEIIFFLILKYTPSFQKRMVAFIIIACIGYGIHFYYILPWGADIAMVVQVFLAVGYYIRNKNVPIDFRLILPAIILLFVAYFYNMVDTSSRIYGNIFLYFIGGISGSLIVFFISKCLSTKGLLKWLTYCGRESLGILFWHFLGFKVTGLIVSHIVDLPSIYVYKKLFFLMFIGAVLFSLLVVYCKNHLRAKLLSKNHTRLALLLNW